MLEYWDLDQPDKCLAWDVHVDAIGELIHVQPIAQDVSMLILSLLNVLVAHKG